MSDGTQRRNLIDAALALDDEARAAFMEAAGQAHPGLFDGLNRPAFLPDLDNLILSATSEPHPAFEGTERFRLERLLGSGGFGDVYEAIDSVLGATVALKVLREYKASSIEGFKRGFRALECLAHPNLCQMYELLFDTGTSSWLLTMECIDGVPLDRYLAHHPEQQRAIFAQVAQGLFVLHDSGILHCDIKPSNVLVTASGRAVLLDFGLTQFASTAGIRVSALTPAFAAPELISGGAHTTASDWYAVGKMLCRVADHQTDDTLNSLAVRLVHEDPALRPSRDEIRAFFSPAAAWPMTAGQTNSPFTGREEQLLVLEQAFKETLGGAGRLIRVRGDSGIGKTVFCREGLRRLRQREPRLLVFEGGCHRGESVPFKAFDEIMDLLCAHLRELPLREAVRVLPDDLALIARIFPVARSLTFLGGPQIDCPDPQELRRRTFAALAGLIGNLARQNPMVFVIDDLQWSDADSNTLLRELISLLFHCPVLWLVAERHSEEALAGDLAAVSVPVRNIELGPLPAAQCRFLAEQWLGREYEEFFPGIVAEAGGNPFLLGQLSLHVRSGGQTGAIQDLVSRRLSQLAPPERRLLEVLAIARVPLPPNVLQRASQVGNSFLGAQNHLAAAQLMRLAGPGGSLLTTYHDRISESVAALLTAEGERQTHEALAGALEDACEPDLESIALHYNLAGRQESALRYGRLAAEQSSAALAFDRAARLYEEVIRWAGPHAMDAASLHQAHGEALANGGRGVEAARAFTRAQAVAPPELAEGLRIRTMSQLLRSGAWEDGLQALGSLMRDFGLPFPQGRLRGIAALVWQRLRVELRRRTSLAGPLVAPNSAARLELCWAAIVGTSMVQPLLAEIYCLVYLRLALECGSPKDLALAWSSFATRLAYVDDGVNEEARALMRQAAAFATADGSPYALAYTEGMQAVLEMLSGNWRQSRAFALESVGQFRRHCQGVAWEIASVSTYVFTAQILTGDWRGNEIAIPKLVEEARGRGDRYAAVSLQLITGFYATFLANDEPNRAEESVLSCLAEWPGHEFDIQRHYALQAMVDIDLYRGRAAEAWQRIERSWPAVQGSGLLRLTLLDNFAHACRGRAALALAAEPNTPADKKKALVDLVKQTGHKLCRSRSSYAPGLGMLLLAGTAALTKDPEAELQWLEKAEVELARQELVPWHAMTLRAIGRRRQIPAAAGMDWITNQQIRRPECISRMLLPAVA